MGLPMTTRPPTLPAALWVIPAVYFLLVAGEFVVLTTLALDLTAGGASALSVGVMGSALWLGIFASSTGAHALVTRHGHARVLVGATLASLLAAGSLPLHGAYGGWLIGVVLLGLSSGLVWVAGESWLAEAAPRERRGFFIGLFETAVGLGMVAGPALVPLARHWGLPPLWLGVLLIAAALLFSVRMLREPGPTAHEMPSLHDMPDMPDMPDMRDAPRAPRGATSGSPPPAWRQLALRLASVAVLGGLMESGISSMLPSISMRVGFDIATAAWLGAVIGAGSALLQSPFGALADRFGLRRTMALAWALILLATTALLLGAEHPQRVLWGAGFVLGGVGGAVYTLIVIELGHRLAGGSLVKAMGLLVSAYTGGTVFGPVLGGWLFDAAGLQGLAVALLVCGLLGAALAWRALRPAAGYPMLST